MKPCVLWYKHPTTDEIWTVFMKGAAIEHVALLKNSDNVYKVIGELDEAGCVCCQSTIEGSLPLKHEALKEYTDEEQAKLLNALLDIIGGNCTTFAEGLVYMQETMQIIHNNPEVMH